MSWTGLMNAFGGLAGGGQGWAGGKKEHKKNSVPGHSHSTDSLGCLPMISAGLRHSFSFSLFPNAQHWAFHLLPPLRAGPHRESSLLLPMSWVSPWLFHLLPFWMKHLASPGLSPYPDAMTLMVDCRRCGGQAGSSLVWCLPLGQGACGFLDLEAGVLPFPLKMLCF